MTEYYREFIPLFLNESRKVLTEFKCEEQGAALGTKQAIKSHVYDQLEVSDVLKKCLKEGMKGKVKLGAVKHQILQFLTQLTVVLPKSFW